MLHRNEWNYLNCSDPRNLTKVFVTPMSPDSDPDPAHSVPDTTEQVFCGAPESTNPAPMNGFAMSGIHRSIGPQVPFGMFSPQHVPIMSTLAAEFAVFDRYHSSIPGPTQVNRMYVNTATSHGAAFNNDQQLIEGYPQHTIFEDIDKSGLDWGIFYAEVPSVLFLSYVRKPSSLKNLHTYEDFRARAASGTLPTYSFMEPRYFAVTNAFDATDQHPSHSMAAGEGFIKEIYEELRASPKWNNTLFIVTYDEHGGFFDHVPTPVEGVPNPDGMVSADPPFNFTRLGVRVPFLAISPLIPRGTIVHEPVGPEPTSHYEHSSIPATLRKMFNLTGDFLTKRDAWAGTFESVLSLSVPRTDCPEKLPEPVELIAAVHSDTQPPSELQCEFIALATAAAHGRPAKCEHLGLKTETEAACYVARVMESYLHPSVPLQAPTCALLNV
jgi:phospholipase C